MSCNPFQEEYTWQQLTTKRPQTRRLLSNMQLFNRFIVTLAITCYLGIGYSSAIGSAESGRSKFGLYIVRSPETTIAPTGDEVVLECGLSVNPERIVWRFLPQNASKEHRQNFRIIETSSVSGLCGKHRDSLNVKYSEYGLVSGQRPTYNWEQLLRVSSEN